MLVARFTFTPEKDIERGWSGWIGEDWPSFEEAAIELLATYTEIDEDVLDDLWEEWQDPDWHSWHHRDLDSYDEFLQDLLEENEIEVSFNEAWKRWQHVHHAGLSCWALEASTFEEAVEEAKGSAQWHGFGDATEGRVKYLGPVEGEANLHIFECESVSPELG